MQTLLLSQLNRRIADTLADTFRTPIWIVAEVASIRRNATGYTYLELVEKRADTVLAKTNAKFWTPTTAILTIFERATGITLCPGMKILFRAQVVFHTAYGLSLILLEIDPSYSLGDMARQRREVLDRLNAEGLIDKNKKLPFAAAPQRVAVISSDQAAGLQDFLYRIANNPHTFTFSLQLFPAIVQGAGAAASIQSAMMRIAAQSHQFDCIALIRGGGGAIDLSCFDSYVLARSIANCPLPVICGVGHQKDRSVCDEVSAQSVGTPTAAAEFLITKLKTFEDELDSLAHEVDACVRKIFQRHDNFVEKIANNFTIAARKRISKEQLLLNGVAQRTFTAARSTLELSNITLTETVAALKIRPTTLLEREVSSLAGAERELFLHVRQALAQADQELSQVEKDVRRMDPAEILRRGFSITRVAGRAIRNPKGVTVGARIETVVFGGRMESIVERSEETP